MTGQAVATNFVARMLLLATIVATCFCQAVQMTTLAPARVVEGPPSSIAVPRADGNNTLKIDVDLVLIPITVTDAIDRVMIGLAENKFSIYDDGNQQVIRHFSTEDAPISLGVIFDTSSSMSGKIDRSREAALQFFRSANPDDEFFMIGFNDRPEVLAGFTDPQIATAAPTPFSPSHFGTPSYRLSSALS